MYFADILQNPGIARPFNHKGGFVLELVQQLLPRCTFLYPLQRLHSDWQPRYSINQGEYLRIPLMQWWLNGLHPLYMLPGSTVTARFLHLLYAFSKSSLGSTHWSTRESANSLLCELLTVYLLRIHISQCECRNHHLRLFCSFHFLFRYMFVLNTRQTAAIDQWAHCHKDHCNLLIFFILKRPKL